MNQVLHFKESAQTEFREREWWLRMNGPRSIKIDSLASACQLGIVLQQPDRQSLFTVVEQLSIGQSSNKAD